jgi:hypothetical protein
VSPASIPAEIVIPERDTERALHAEVRWLPSHDTPGEHLRRGECRRRDEEARADGEKRGVRGLDHALHGQREHPGHARPEHDQPDYAALRRALPRRGEAAQESEYVAAEVDDHRDERGQVQEDLEREVGTAAEETVRDGQMAVRGHGKELGQPLDDAEHERLQDGHARPP